MSTSTQSNKIVYPITTNTDWGFFGTLKSNYGLSDKATAVAFGEVALKVKARLNVSIEIAVKYLDSTYGRHLADSLSFHGMDAKGDHLDAIAAFNTYANENEKSFKKQVKTIQEMK